MARRTAQKDAARPLRSQKQGLKAAYLCIQQVRMGRKRAAASFLHSASRHGHGIGQRETVVFRRHGRMRLLRQGTQVKMPFFSKVQTNQCQPLQCARRSALLLSYGADK